MKIRNCCVFPSLRQLRRRGLMTTPIAFAAAQAAACFVRHFPDDLMGVYPPEALPATVRTRILRSMQKEACRFETQTTSLELDRN